jgi:hypothetical protein
MAGLVPAIHVLAAKKGVDARAFATPKGFGPAGGSSPGMTTEFVAGLRQH